jgi:hypothetical protein
VQVRLVGSDDGVKSHCSRRGNRSGQITFVSHQRLARVLTGGGLAEENLISEQTSSQFL